MENIAFLWWEDHIEWGDADRPFREDWKNKNYALFSDIGAERDLKVVCGSYEWYENGKMRKAWRWTGEKWRKVENVDIELVYDLFQHNKEKHELKQKMEQEVEIVSDPGVTDICSDKWKTYEKFSDHIPETRKATREEIEDMLDQYKEVILKPRYGSGGEGIVKISDISELDGSLDPETTIVQRFIENPEMKKYGIEGPHDLRILFVGGEAVRSYIRKPTDDFRSNLDQGGKAEYIDIEELDDEVMKKATEIKNCFKDLSSSVVAIDFMFENGEPHLIELNSQPGISPYRPECDKEIETEVMRKVVDLFDNLVS